MKEILEGMNSSETPITYYAKEMRYPKIGGFKKFLSTFSNEKNIRYHQEVIQIDTKNKIVCTIDNVYHYEHLFSSIPLPEYKHLIKNISEDIVSNIEQLHWTSGYTVSLGMKGELLKKHLWDYIYDEDILPARIYSPSEKSPDNVPKGCCSLQAEVYFRDDKLPKTDMKSILEDTICNLHKIDIIDRQSLVVKDIRFEKYANVIFDHNIYYTRDRGLSYLKSQNIIPIGRFGEWEYLWSDQSFINGYNSIKGTE